jgi:carbamoyl-phosphate synthase large subunit
MASTGEIAAFGKDIHEAYWASLLSQTNFKLPQLGSGVLLGGDTSKPEFAIVAKALSDLGFKLYCSTPAVEQYIAQLPYCRKAKRLFFPATDKRKLREIFDEFDLQLVVNLAKLRGRDTVDTDYIARRNGVDFGLVMIVRPLRRCPLGIGVMTMFAQNNARCAQLFVEAMAKRPLASFGGYHEGRAGPECVELSGAVRDS